jgi:nucleotide-binding universal stress UspA family protein
MIKNILVCTDGSAHGTAACRYAAFLSRQLQARLIGLHVLDSRMLEGPMMADISGWVGAQPYGAQLRQFRELMEEKGQSVVAALNELCEQDGVEVESWTKMGHPSRVMLEEESRAELLILGQKGEHAQWGGDMMGSNAERVVRHSVKPCLVTPETFDPITKVLIAYDGSGHAGQALTEAVELALALQVELVIATAVEDDDQDKAQAVSNDARKQAAAHGCTAANLVIEGQPEEAILETAREHKCDLVVVGAYGHSRIREMILGSTTVALITRSHLPVMLVR